MKGYKVFKPDFTCGGFQYEVGQTYKHVGDIELCGSGFHFCNKLIDCFNYYGFNSNNKVAEIEAVGTVLEGEDKLVTNEIKIIREITWSEVLELVNSGNGNSGHYNSGDCNSGNGNSGHYNSGHCNSGMFNACNHSNGLFNSKSPKIYIFNKPTKLTYEEFLEKYREAYDLLRYSKFHLTEWIPTHKMTNEEKIAHPEHKTIEGYLKINDYKTACRKMWDGFSDVQKEIIKKLPNFDSKIFKEITGIEI